MAINPNLLIAAPMLQDYLVDKSTGLPLAAGIVTCYQDTSRTTLKNWYYLSGAPNNYSYVPLPNPMTLSAVGTIVDVNGNDTIPFFYPYDENDNTTSQPYYITVVNSQGQAQFSRQNFPLVEEAVAIQSNPTLQNYIVNNQFWRNQGSVNLGSQTNIVLAPSQHDGFSQGDFRFIKNNTSATETVTFTKFTQGSNPLLNDITPEFYVNHNCTGAGSAETQKVYQFPISLHVNQLEQQEVTVSIQAQGVSGTQTISIFLYEFLGTGVSSPSPTLQQTFVLNTGWNKYSVTFPMPNTTGQTLGTAGDDAYYLQIGMPLNATCNINFTLPSLYLSSVLPSNNFTTYDQVDAIINSPRTGDFRISLNSFAPYGWVLCNDGVLSNSGSFTLPSNIPSARQNVDAWPLFNLLWGIAKPADTGSTFNPIAQIFTSAGAAANYGASAIADWNANKQLQLSLTIGRALIGLPPAMSVTYTHGSAPTWNSGTNGFFTATSTTLLYVGSPVFLTGTMPSGGNFTANTIYYAIPAIDGSSTTQFQLATSYANALAGTAIAAGGAADDGSNLVVNFALGGALGQSRHVQLTNEVGSHTHVENAYFSSVTPAGSNPGTSGPAFTLFTGASTNANTPAGYPFNVVMPAVYYNVFLKL